MRISDWSSDVCSSDLRQRRRHRDRLRRRRPHARLGGDADRDRYRLAQFRAVRRWRCAVSGNRRRAPLEHSFVMPDFCSGIQCASNDRARGGLDRSEEHTSELQSLMRISYAVFCLKKKINDEKTRKCKTMTKEE